MKLGMLNNKQAGYASLGIGVALLFMLSLMTVYLTKSGIVDIRSSAAKARYGEALAVAEGRIEQGLAWLYNNSTNLNPSDNANWAGCTSLTVADELEDAGWDEVYDGWRCYSHAIYELDGLHIAAQQVGVGGPWLYNVVALGKSDDGEATAVVKQGVHNPRGGWSRNELPPPMMGAGAINLSGTFDVVANSDAAGQGIPVSIWSNQPVNSDPGGGSWATCHMGDFMQSGATNTTRDCSSVSPLSEKGSIRSDIIVGGDFPTDMFEHVFGIPTADYRMLKNSPAVVRLSSCASLAAVAAANYGVDENGNPNIPIVWVTGDCDIGNSVVGSQTKPIVLVVEPNLATAALGKFEMSAGAEFYGLFFAFSENGDAGDVKANGNGDFHGSMLSNDSTSFGINLNGGFNLIFQETILNRTNSAITDVVQSILAKMPGSWADYLR